MGGSLELALIAGLLLVGGMVLERLLLRWRFDPYFTWGIPLDEVLVPISEAPKGSGSTQSVDWEVVHENLVRWWSPPGRRAGPVGLHGSIALLARRNDVALAVRWSPPWTPLIGAGWLVSLGFTRGDWIAVPIGIALFGLLLYAYRLAALRAAAELRWAFVNEA